MEKQMKQPAGDGDDQMVVMVAQLTQGGRKEEEENAGEGF